MVGIIILFALGMSVVIKFIEKMTGFHEGDNQFSDIKEPTKVTTINEP